MPRPPTPPTPARAPRTPLLPQAPIPDTRSTADEVADRAAQAAAKTQMPPPQPAPPEDPREPLETRVLRGRKLTVILRSGERVESCRLEAGDRYNWLFVTLSPIASAVKILVPKHAVDSIHLGERIP